MKSNGTELKTKKKQHSYHHLIFEKSQKHTLEKRQAFSTNSVRNTGYLYTEDWN
jgi:hypothetical protein